MTFRLDGRLVDGRFVEGHLVEGTFRKDVSLTAFWSTDVSFNGRLVENC